MTDKKAAVYSASVEKIVNINAPRQIVWRALTHPEQVVVWDTGIVRPLDAPPDYPQPGHIVHWKYSLSGLPMTLIDRPQEVKPLEKLRTLITLGFMRFDETYFLKELGSDSTELTALLRVGNVLPFFRETFDYRIGRTLAGSTVSSSLNAIRDFCEMTYQQADH